jgi:hypothetical protein
MSHPQENGVSVRAGRFVKARNEVKPALIKRCASGGWLSIKEMTEAIREDMQNKQSFIENDVKACLERMSPSTKYPYRCERSGKSDGSTIFRIVKVQGRVIPRNQMRKHCHEIIPLLDRLIKEACKPYVELSTPAICDLATKLKRVFEAITADVPTSKNGA